MGCRVYRIVSVQNICGAITCPHAAPPKNSQSRLETLSFPAPPPHHYSCPDTMADVADSVPVELQARQIVYCGGESPRVPSGCLREPTLTAPSSSVLSTPRSMIMD